MSDSKYPAIHQSALRKALTSKLHLSALGVFIVFVLCVAYIISGVLGTPLTSRPKSVNVDLKATGGLFVGSSVTYRGVRVGRVTKIDFRDGGVRAVAQLTSSKKIPADSKAVVRSLSPVGEQYLDFQPPNSDGPYLQNGSTIAASNTSIPQSLASTVISVSNLLDQINPKNLHTVLDEASKAFAGTSTDLGRLTDQSQEIISDLNKYWPNASRVITNSGTLLDIGVADQAKIQSAAHDFKVFASFLKSYDPELLRTLKGSPADIKQLRALVGDAKDVLPTFLRLGGDISTLLGSYTPHLRVLLSQFAPGLSVLGKAVKDGSLQLTIIGQPDHYCDYSTTRLNPKDPSTRGLQKNGHCPSSFQWDQRGAAHAPGPVK
ncbi:MAG TPA: MlaD family protein [Marmoricola sp.]